MPPNPLYDLPFDPPVANALQAEFEALPWRCRASAQRKAALRTFCLHWTGQRRLLHDRVPPSVRHVLWIYSWTTIGDAIMDLAARTLIPPHVRVDLCIDASLTGLFAGDSRFTQVMTDATACDPPPDFVLLDCLSTAALRSKTRYAAKLPFATLRGQLLGEQYDRLAYGDRRLRQLFGIAPGSVGAPRIAVPPSRPEADATPVRVAVALGARDRRRLYAAWPAVLDRVLASWPVDWPPPRFCLLGGCNAADDLAGFRDDFLLHHCEVRVDCGTLRQAAEWLGGCTLFLGADGGLMHIAMALEVPGLALLADVHPAYRIRACSGMDAMLSPCRLDDLAPTCVAERFMRTAAAHVRRAGTVSMESCATDR